MKKIITLLFITFFTLISFSQDLQTIPTLFEVGNEVATSKSVTTGKGNRMEAMLKNPINTEIRSVYFSNLYNMALESKTKQEYPGYFKFSIPKSRKSKGITDILSIPKQIETLQLGNYTYVADLSYGKYGNGNLILLHKNGKNFGSMTLGNRSSSIVSTDADGEVLIELDQKTLNSPVACATQHSSKSPVNSKTTTSAKTTNNCTSSIVRVLVLFTDNANAVSDPNQLASLFISELNSSKLNSQVYTGVLSYKLAGVENIDFNESNNPIADLNDLVTNNDLNTERDNAGADLVVVLTDGNYQVAGGTVLGIATLDQYSQPDQGHVAIVEADAGDFTFAHEVGHLMGCRHDDDTRTNVPNLSDTAKGHSWYYRNWFLGPKKYQKSMVASGLTNGSRVMYFSNPNVKANSKARDNSGTSTRNNAQQLKNAATVVGCYDDFVEMGVSISGPSQVNIGQPYTLSANVTNCPTRTYLWERSDNGFSYSVVSTSSSYSYVALPYDPSYIYFRLTVTCSDGQSRTVFHGLTVLGGSGASALQAKTNISKDVDLDNQEDQPNIFMVYPNPVFDEFTLATNFENKKGITVHLHNIMNGKEHRIFKGTIDKGTRETLIGVSRSNQGLYQLIVKEKNR